MTKPECIGPYTLLAPLGEAARQRVWLARIGDRPQRVVLKLAREGLAADRKRLQHEVDILSTFNHPNIVRMLECGESNAVLWMATDYVAGPYLPLQLGNFRQLLLALVHLHANDVIHADIKPANLLLDADGNVQLLGFGNARRIGTGAMPPGGMPQFMSPEQIRGEALDLRADLFSAGAVLFLILTGKRAFEGTAMPGRGEAPTPALPLPSVLAPGLGTGFDKLISKLLAPNREDRYADAFAVLADFDAACHWGVRRSV